MKFLPISKTSFKLCTRTLIASYFAWMSWSACAAPGVATAPATVFLENFENRPDSSMAQKIGDYIGSGGANFATYTASPYYQSTLNCNGLVFAQQNDVPFDCALVNLVDLKRLAAEMAKLQGLGPSAAQSNSIMLEYTYSLGGAVNDVVLESVNPISVTRNRFLTLSVDLVDISCESNLRHAALNFFLVDGATPLPLNSSPLTACNGSGAKTGAMHVLGTKPYLMQSNSLKLRITNEEAAYSGNDFAFDNFALLDVTPKLDKAFAPGPLPGGAYAINAPARMTFTITNRTDLLEKIGWGFVESLPLGIVIAPIPNLATTCGSSTLLSATPGGTTLTASNGTLASGATACTIAVNVTAANPGTYTNMPANITSITGLDLPEEASVVFDAPATLTLHKKLSAPRVNDTDQFTLAARYPLSLFSKNTTGAGLQISSTPLVVPLVPSTEVTVTESGMASVLQGYQTSYACTNKTAGGDAPQGTGRTFTFTAKAADALNCVFTNTPIADLSVTKTADVPQVRTGKDVKFTVSVLNNGPSRADGAVLRDALPPNGLDCSSPPGGVATCTASNGANCPAAPIGIGALASSNGIVIPTLPAQGTIALVFQCNVTATGVAP